MPTNASTILRRRYIKGDAAAEGRIEEYKQSAEIARQIYALRQEAGLTQKQLAQKVGTTASVICQLENTAYQGHSVSMLRRIADALGADLQVQFAPAAGTKHLAA